MSDDERRTRTVTLEVDPSSYPIRGVARDESGVERTFRGWVGLAAALEQTFDLGGEHPAGGPQHNEHEGELVSHTARVRERVPRDPPAGTSSVSGEVDRGG